MFQIVGVSPVMKRIRESVNMIRAMDIDSRINIFLSGERGTGKTYIAHALHAGKPDTFSHIDCASIPASLAESELFGHRRGSFTGASQAASGMIGKGQLGTVFFDEIGILDWEIQRLLLRFAENKVYARIGQRDLCKVRCRIISASNVELKGNERFRQDLYDRLAGIRIDIPPLRERREDITVLAQHYAAECGLRLTRRDIGMLVSRDWPGNIRELIQAIRAKAASGKWPQLTQTVADIIPMHEAKRKIVLDAVAACGGNHRAASMRLKISHNTITRILQGVER